MLHYLVVVNFDFNLDAIRIIFLFLVVYLFVSDVMFVVSGCRTLFLWLFIVGLVFLYIVYLLTRDIVYIACVFNCLFIFLIHSLRV